jgi:hypothetical protein
MKKSIFSTAAALLLSAGVLFASAANAEVLVFDDAGNATFGVSHADTGAYTDEFLFKVATESQGWVSGTAIAGKTLSGISRLFNYGITGVEFFRVNADSSRSMLGTDATTGNSVEFFMADTLTAGNYGFAVHGYTTLDGLGGSYAGNLNLVTAPVPEPASYGMLAAGLGMLAFTARRNKSQKLH